MSLDADWEKYVAPFIKHPGNISLDPVVAAAHLTNLRWMEAIGHSHDSRTDPEYHIKVFRMRILDETTRGSAAAIEGNQKIVYCLSGPKWNVPH